MNNTVNAEELAIGMIYHTTGSDALWKVIDIVRVTDKAITVRAELQNPAWDASDADDIRSVYRTNRHKLTTTLFVAR